MAGQHKRITNRFGDMEGNTLIRLMRMYLYFKCVPVVNLGNGPTLKFLLQMLALHYLARPVYRVAIRFENQVARFFEWRAARRHARREGNET